MLIGLSTGPPLMTRAPMSISWALARRAEPSERGGERDQTAPAGRPRSCAGG